jgi:hypothetical protein
MVAAGPVAWVALMLGLRPRCDGLIKACTWSTVYWCACTLFLFFLVLQGRAGKWTESFVEVPRWLTKPATVI